MAWQQTNMKNDAGQPLWYDPDTGNYTDVDPTPSGQYASGTTLNEGTSERQITDAATGRVVVDPAEIARAETQFTKQLDDKFQSVWRNPSASSWDKAMAVQERYGVETLAQLTGQGYFSDIAAELGPHIAARQREGEAEGFSIGGNQLGLWPVILSMMGAGAYSGLYGGTTSATAAPSAAGVGGSTATQVGMSGAIGAGAEGAGAAAGTGAAEGAGYFGGADVGVGAGEAGLGAGTGSTEYFGGMEMGAGGAEAGGAASGGSAAAGGTTGGATGGGITAGEAGGAAGGGSALSRLLDGSTTAEDLLALAGKIAPAALGAYASNRQSQSLEDLAGKYMEFGAPSRARYEASFAPGFNMGMDPGYTDALDQTTKSFLHKASVTGNPADSPNAWQQTLKDVNSQFAYPALQDYRRVNAGTGGLAALTSAAPGLDTQSVNAQRGIYDSIGVGVADVFNPPKSLADVLREYRRYA